MLETVVNNLEVTNNLDIQPEMRCRVLMTSTLESFDIGHTIVLSRGLIDVLPDEASLATILARNWPRRSRPSRRYASTPSLTACCGTTRIRSATSGSRALRRRNNRPTQGLELLQNSPYKDQLDTARQFVQVLQTRSKEIPNLISPHLGDRVPVNMAMASAAPAAQPPSNPADPKAKPLQLQSSRCRSAAA